MMIEGSRRLKNMWIRIRIRIRNTALETVFRIYPIWIGSLFIWVNESRSGFKKTNKKEKSHDDKLGFLSRDFLSLEGIVIQTKIYN
jgi:hypothetical protein